jgi:predicted metal-dependent hydrolase
VIVSEMSPVCASVIIDGREVEYRLRLAKSARKLRIRVGVGGVDVIRSEMGDAHDAETFLQANGQWVLAQLDRVSRLQAARRVRRVDAGTMLFRGESMAVIVEETPHPRRSNRVERRNGALAVVTGQGARSTPAKSLERWLRVEARAAIQEQVGIVAARLDVVPGRLYIMDQRTKWGNCSRLGNLSFNWRLIMAPEHVLRYLVAHEAVHLAVPDHSRKFWLTVQSICPETERARQWLVANGDRLLVDLQQAFSPAYGIGSTQSLESTAGKRIRERHG